MNTIRKNPVILIVSIGLAMAGFILMDMLTSGGPGGGADQAIIGKVNGERIDYRVFADTENVLYGNSGQDVFSRRESLWNFFVDKIIVQDLADKLGLGVGKAELNEIQFGQNLSPVIQRNFMNPDTRQVDREQLNNVRQAIENNQLPPDIRRFWAEQEREVIKDRLQAKMASMATKGMYTPTWQAEWIGRQGADRMDIAYVRIPFDAVADSEVTITDADLNAYLSENARKFHQDVEKRAVSYVAMDVRPTSEDSAALIKQLTDLVDAWQDTDNDTLFVENNYGFMDGAYFGKDAFTSDEADALFEIPVGSIHGPFIEGSQYMIVKLLDRKIIPDSVQSRHILIQAQDFAGVSQAQATLDSLKGLIESGKARFDSLAAQYGQDATRDKGGDLGFAAQGQMVKEFNDLIFYQAEPKKLYTITTQFGVHLVEVTDRKFIENEPGIQIAMIAEPIIPSEATQRKMYQRALEIVRQYRTLNDLEKAAGSATDWTIEPSALFEENDFSLGILGQGSAAREIIRWAFGQKSTGSISPEVYQFDDEQLNYTNRYVIAGLSRISPAGNAKLANVRTEVEDAVRKEKKGAKIAELVAGQTDLEAIANRFGSEVDSAANITFNSSFIPGVGNEPSLIGAITSMSEGATSQPITGINGVYVARVTRKTITDSPPSVAQVKAQTRSQRGFRTANKFAEAIRHHAKIKDNRSNFY